MKFLDSVKLNLQAGNGGAGSSALFQDWHQKYPHPDGGNGGNGGSIFLVVNKNLITLSAFQMNSLIVAQSGSNGHHKKKTGVSAQDIYLEVPLGTLVFDALKKNLLYNFEKEDQIFQIAQGGGGGLGNAFFRSKNQNLAKNGQPGSLGEIVTIWLELAFIAQLALIGLPNVGKSSLLNALSNAKAKVANYQFTTLQPNLGILTSPSSQSKIVLADLPGLIAGASKDKGLGNRFLKHGERVRIFLHVLDLSLPPAQIRENFLLLNRELVSYHSYFQTIPQVIIGNKVDLTSSEFDWKFLAKLELVPFAKIKVSALTGAGLEELKKLIFTLFLKSKNWKSVLERKLVAKEQVMTYHYHGNQEIRLQKLQKGIWRLSGPFFRQLSKKYQLAHPSEVGHFIAQIKPTPFYFYLKKAGIKIGDLIEIGSQTFYWQD